MSIHSRLALRVLAVLCCAIAPWTLAAAEAPTPIMLAMTLKKFMPAAHPNYHSTTLRKGKQCSSIGLNCK